MATIDQTPKTKPSEKAKPEKREYLIFLQGAPADDHNPVWIVVGKATATDRDEALDEVVETLDKDERDGPFMAIAARYCVPVSAVVQPPPPPKRMWK